MKVRLLPVLLTFFVAVVVLFGGWFTYQSLAVENPTSDIVSEIDGVEHAQVESERDSLLIRVWLESDAELSTLYNKLLQQTREQAGSRTVSISIEGEVSDRLNEIWHTALFDVAEAMDTKAYGDIPERMHELEVEHSGLQTVAAMDDSYVYITLRLDGKTKYVVLPRVPDRMGVWPNEQVQ